MVNRSTITQYTYGVFNRLMSAGSMNYTYDANGNMLTKSGGWAYSYDYENRLTSVAHNGVVVQSNCYDGDGNRVEQVAGGSTILYSYQGVNILYQKNLTSGTVTKSFYAGGIQVAQMVNYTTYYLHQDALGSIRLVMPASLITSFISNYLPYGMSYAMTGEEAFQYTGKLLDEATGLYYEGARYYDPETGRFITEDSYNGTKTDPISQNKYIYGGDNPMRYVDPTGHWLVSSYRVYGGGAEYHPTPLTTATSKDTTAVTVSRVSGMAYKLDELTHVTTQMALSASAMNGPTIGLAGGGGPTSASLALTPSTTSNSGLNWNAAGSLGILVLSVMATTAEVVFPNPTSPVGLNALGGADASVFEYLTGNPNPRIQGTEEAWWKGFWQGAICSYAGC